MATLLMYLGALFNYNSILFFYRFELHYSAECVGESAVVSSCRPPAGELPRAEGGLINTSANVDCAGTCGDAIAGADAEESHNADGTET